MMEPISTGDGGASGWMARVRQLIGRSVTRVAFDEFAVLIAMEGAEIFIEGRWELRNNRAEIVDVNVRLSERVRFELWRIVSLTIQDVECGADPLPRLRLRLEHGWSLTVFADDDGYEDWSVVVRQPDGTRLGVLCNGPII